METIEQVSNAPLSVSPGLPVAPPPAAPQPTPIQVLPPMKIFVIIASCILLFTTFVLAFRTWEIGLFPLYQILTRRPETIWEGDGSYTPYAWLVKIKQTDQSRSTISVEARDSMRMVPTIISDIQSLKYIFITQQPIRTLPDSIGALQNLKEMYIQNTFLTALPSTIGDLKSLEALFLQGNRLTGLPDSIGDLPNLRILNVAYNRLSSLPASLANLSNVYILDLTGNNFRTFPTNLPPHLSVLFLGGNPIPRKVIETTWPGATQERSYLIFY